MKRLMILIVSAASSFASADCTLIENASVDTADGVEVRTVAIDGGVIVEPERVPADCERIDAAGLTLTAGLIDAASNAGLMDVPSVSSTNDGRLDGYALGAGFDPSLAINPASEVIRVARIDGVLAGALLPTAGGDPFAGLVHAFAYSYDVDQLTNAPAGLFAAFGNSGAALTGGSRAATVQHLIEAVREARHYDANRRQYDRGSHPPYRFSRLDLEALAALARRDFPLFASANRATDIRTLLDVTDDLGIDLVIFGGADAWKLAAEIADRGVIVVLNPLTNHAEFEYLGARLDNAALLHAAGVEVAISPFAAYDSRRLRQLAGIAVANGLPRETAIAAITTVPAKLLRIGALTGAPTIGRRADVVLWNGDPLELASYPERIFVGGVSMDLRSRQIRLAERYRDLQSPQPLQLR